MIRSVLLAAIAVAFAVAWTSSAADWVPTIAAIQHLETKIQMPRGAGAITGYVRYYAGIDVSGRKMIEGVFLSAGTARSFGRDREPGIHIVPVSKLPAIDDGGCGVVTVNYDVARDRIIGIVCNGVA